MKTREIIEKREQEYLSKYASLSINTLGRDEFEEKCDIRTDYQRDRDRILHSKAFRRLKHKTQVFLSPQGDHYRTRLTHTLEVAQIARTIARALNLNEDLTEAIALGHDLGHTPFGHSGEEVLNRIHYCGFEHNVQSLRVVEVLEKSDKRKGLNLTKETRDGILNHRGKNEPFTLEGQIVRLSDRIAYLNHDTDDALRAGILRLEDLPKIFLDNFGITTSQRVNFFIVNTIKNSVDKDKISIGEENYKLLLDYRDFMFKNIYFNEAAKSQEHKCKKIVEYLYNYYSENVDYLYENYIVEPKNVKNEIYDDIKDYIAGMTDNFIVNTYKNLVLPNYTL